MAQSFNASPQHCVKWFEERQTGLQGFCQVTDTTGGLWPEGTFLFGSPIE